MIENTLPQSTLAHTLGKGALFAVLGSAAAFALFAVMAYLATSNNKSFSPVETPFQVSVHNTPEDSETKVIKQKLPEPPTPPTAPPRTEAITETAQNTLGTLTPDIDINVPKVGLSGIGMGDRPDGDAMPIVRSNPVYPKIAARDGIQGWVQLAFTIDELGAVTDIEVVDSEPKRIFDRNAKRALKKWKYKPKMVDGKAMKQFGQKVVLEFNLDQH